jgi:hypothetical protein
MLFSLLSSRVGNLFNQISQTANSSSYDVRLRIHAYHHGNGLYGDHRGDLGAQGLPFLLLIDPGDESFKLSTIEPDTSTQLANIYGDTIPVLFFQSRFVASRTKHVNSFFI